MFCDLGPYNINKNSHHHIKITTFKKNHNSNNLLHSSLSTHIMTSSDTTLSIESWVGQLHFVCTLDPFFSPDTSHSLSTFRLNMMTSSHIPDVKNDSEYNSLPNSTAWYFVLVSKSLIISLKTISPVLTHCSRASS